MTYSSMILKPIIENPQINLNKFIKNCIPNTNSQEIEKAIEKINELKLTQTGRELYITIGAVYLKELISKLTQNKFQHFSLFSSLYYKDKEKIVIAGFRMKEELQTISKLYPDAKIIKILIQSTDKIRHARIISRDNIDINTILENEKYEKETTYNKLLGEVNFEYVIENNTTNENLENQLNSILKQS